MRLERLTLRGFRNLRDAELAWPAEGAVLLGPNGQGKTNLLEAIYYPVLYRSLRGALDPELVRHGDTGFHLGIRFERAGSMREASAEFRLAGRRKRIALDGAPLERLVDGAGEWCAVAFVPEDVRLASGAAAERRRYLDRTLALADRSYLVALTRYRAALAQRNAALRSGHPDVAARFDAPLAADGAQVVARRLAWLVDAAPRFGAELAALGEPAGPAAVEYAGHAELAEREAWPGALAHASDRDRRRGTSTIGPHRDDLRLTLAGRSLREFGSTGQQRSAAIALKLLELETLREAMGECPVLLLDDVFAELDRERQLRLSARLLHDGPAQVLLTSPRRDELPPDLALPVWRVEGGRVDQAEDVGVRS